MSLFVDAVSVTAIGWMLLAVVRNLTTYQHLRYAAVPVCCSVVWLGWNAVREYRRLQDPRIAGRQIDQQARLDNRITTAIEYAHTTGNATADLVVQDAAESIQQVRPVDMVRMPPSKRALLSFAALATSGLALLASPFIVRAVAMEQQPMNMVLDDAHQNAVLDIVQQTLASLKQEAAENPSSELDALIESTKQTLEKLKAGQLSTSEAYLELSRRQQQMLAASHPLGSAEKMTAWQQVADALESSGATEAVGELLQSKQFDAAVAKMEQIEASSLSKEKLTPAEMASLSEKLAAAAKTASAASDPELANVLKDLSAAAKQGNSKMAEQQMKALAAESAKYQIELEQAQHLDELAEQLGMGKQQMAIKSNSSGDGQMGGQGLNEETGQSESKGGADSQKAGAKTAGNIDGPKADLEGKRKLAELQGQFGEQGETEVKTKSTDARPDFEITRQAQAVHSEYSRQLEADLQQQHVPAGHQEIVRKYFEAIRPKAAGHK